MSERPRIGVTRWEDVPDEARDRYWARVAEAGGEVVDLNEAAVGRVAEIVPSLDALMLTGGVDVDPSKYGAAERHPKVKETVPDRDDMELAYLEAALQRDLPVLAICRGHQLLNVGFGGALLQHIDGGEHRADYRAEGYPSRWHELAIDDDSLLAEIFETTSLHINSRHHQAVTSGTLAGTLRPVAFAEDHGRSLIEGMESEQHRWVLGVQWHPERPEPHVPSFAPAMRRLFAALIAQTSRVRA
jgi:gamma-glutamyl-gamma-aminobutyrate hydrolase PuuD